MSGNDDGDRLISSETANDTGYYWQQNTAGSNNISWTGSPQLDINFSATENVLHNVLHLSDIADNDSWVTVDGVDADTQADAASLVPADSTTVTLGARTDANADQYAGIYGGQFYLDLTGVTADVTFKSALQIVINNAARNSNYNPHTIARAIIAFNSDIGGFYYALTELNAGDASSYYLLAYRMDGVVMTSDSYGLVSPSGVTGTVITVGGTSNYGLKKSNFGNRTSNYSPGIQSNFGPYISSFGGN